MIPSISTILNPMSVDLSSFSIDITETSQRSVCLNIVLAFPQGMTCLLYLRYYPIWKGLSYLNILWSYILKGTLPLTTQPRFLLVNTQISFYQIYKTNGKVWGKCSEWCLPLVDAQEGTVTFIVISGLKT